MPDINVNCIVNCNIKLSEPTKEIFLSAPLAYNNTLAHAMRVTVYNDDGTEADLTGVGVTMLMILALSILFRLPHDQYVTLLPKNVTTAIGLGISEANGGYPSITIVWILLTGNLGNAIAEPVIGLFKIDDPVARGVAIGSSSHAVGTAKALEIGEIEGAISGLSLAVTGLISVVVAAVFAQLY